MKRTWTTIGVGDVAHSLAWYQPLFATKHDGMQVDSILIDQTKFVEALRQVRASNFNLAVALGPQLADCAPKVMLNKRGVGADRLQFNERETTHFTSFRQAVVRQRQPLLMTTSDRSS